METIREDAQRTEMKFIAAQYHSRARISQAKFDSII